MQSQDSYPRRLHSFDQKCQYCHMSTALFQKDCQCISCQCCLFLNDSEMKRKLKKARPCKICHRSYKRVSKQYGVFERTIREEARFEEERHRQFPFEQLEIPNDRSSGEHQVINHLDFFDHQTDISHTHDEPDSLETTGHGFIVNEVFQEASPVITGRRAINLERTHQIQSLLQALTPRNLLSQLEQCY